MTVTVLTATDDAVDDDSAAPVLSGLSVAQAVSKTPNAHTPSNDRFVNMPVRRDARTYRYCRRASKQQAPTLPNALLVSGRDGP
ncbi:hypothetical protein DFJ75_5007 [Williamsia muralis]|uniref:Uncharacterized protein n=1 Tax=Williamsia marianensis TaxID=85044 RepID=A0A495IV21_WILMA|nr:hypothetical protein DFJ75_5007 [Williamsia muralis]